MRVLLVDPPFHAFLQYDRWYFPHALAQLASELLEDGYEVAIYDSDRYSYKDPATRNRAVMMQRQQWYYDQVGDTTHPIWLHFKKALADYNPDVVGVSVYTSKLQSALIALNLIKGFNPRVRTCVGGPHVTAAPKSFTANKDVDAVFTGWADVTFRHWIKDKCPPGIFVGNPKKIDMASIPYPHRESLMFIEHYTARDMALMSTRMGCVGRCTFCSNGIMSNYSILAKNEETVQSELLEIVQKWQARDLMVMDPSFTDEPELSRRMARIIRQFDVTWTANGRWQSIHSELIEYFMTCNCNRLGVGLESGSDKILREMRKGCDTKMIVKKAKVLKELKISWSLYCIVGFPDETIDDMKKTRDLAMALGPTEISLNSLAPLPGTKIYQQILGMTPEFAATLNQLNPNHCFSKYMDLGTFRQMFREMLETFDSYNENNKSSLTIDKDSATVKI